MSFYENKSTGSLIKELKNLDYGFSNPRKAKMANDDANDIERELRSRGFNNEAIRRLQEED